MVSCAKSLRLRHLRLAGRSGVNAGILTRIWIARPHVYMYLLWYRVGRDKNRGDSLFPELHSSVERVLDSPYSGPIFHVNANIDPHQA
jgi:hypothetical protein